jgi:hypothetical protein
MFYDFFMTLSSGRVSQRYGSADSDPYQNVTDLQHYEFEI